MADVKDDIERYLRGEMSSAERHALEKKALYDPFLADGLEGAESISPDHYVSDVMELEKRIQGAKKKNSWFWPMRIAASFLLITTIALLVYNSLPKEQSEKLAEQKEEPTATETLSTGESTAIKGNDQELLTLNQSKEEGPAKTKKSALAATTDETKPKQIPTAEPTTMLGQGNLPTDQIFAESEEANLTDEAKERIAKAEPSLEKKREMALDQDISRSKAPSPVTAQAFTNRKVQGRVTSADDGGALSGVNVIVKGSSAGTVTDVQGNYSLPLSKDNDELQFFSIGLRSIEIAVENKSTLDVKMDEDAQQLSEVVVTGYDLANSKGGAASTVTKLAEPIGGRKALKKYLNSNVHYPQQALERKIEGRVTIQFLVHPDGSLTDFSVLQGIGFGCDEEVIRLIKAGPAWSPTLRDTTPVTERANVQMRFKLP